MPVTSRIPRRSFNLAIGRVMMRVRDKTDDRGAVLVTVVVVMMVGVAAAVLIAAYVTYAIWSNSNNASRTQAFIAAESGRDVMLAAVMSNPCATEVPDVKTGDGARYQEVSAQFSDPASGVPLSCLSTTATTRMLITATGLDAKGAQTTIATTYVRAVTRTDTIGGTVSYFAGQFKVRQSSYSGDLVIRDRPYLCNSTATINGNLWVLNSTATFSADCTINGSIYAYGGIDITSAKVKVTGDLVSEQGITLKSSQAEISGGVYANGNFTYNSGTLTGKYVVGGTKTGGGTPGNTAASVAGCNANAPDPRCVVPAKPATTTKTPGTDQTVPSLSDVEGMTRWKDLSAVRNAWGTGVQWIAMTGADCNGTNALSKVPGTLSAGNTRVGLDYTGCAGAVTVKIGSSPNAIRTDMVFLVPPSSRMTIDAQGPFTLTGQPQLFIIHGDGDAGTPGPNCSAGGTDSLSVSNAGDPLRMMVYTPCGLGSANHLTFNGQYYSNDAGEPDWVQSTFQCRDMAWDPLINLSCQISTAVTIPGDPTYTLSPPVLTTQTESPG